MYVADLLLFGVNVNCLLMMIFTSLLICIAFIDWDTLEMYIPMLLLIAVLAIPSHFATYIPLRERIIGIFVISVPFLLIGEISGYCIKKKTGEKVRGIELGDTILMACAGALIGWKAMIPSAFIGIILAAIFGLIIKKVTGSSKFAFGPYLCAGLWLGAVFGEEITTWYILNLTRDDTIQYYSSLLLR